MRIGLGYDIHRLVPDKPLLIGGVSIPSPLGSDAHSDGDALAHAITDAMLGAVGLGNIGLLFPDTDPQYLNADSMLLMAEAYKQVQERGYRLMNIDANIVLQTPKLNPHINDIRESLAQCLDMHLEDISIKPKTNEEVGPEGRGEAISVQAAVLVNKKS